MNGPPAPTPRFATLLDALAAAAAGDEAYRFIDRDEREQLLSHAELHRRARRFAASLAALGVAPGDRVALVLPTGPGFFVAFLGTLAAGAVPVPLYPPVRLGRLPEYHAATQRMLTRVGAVLVLSEPRVLALLGETVARARPRLGARIVAEVEAAARGEHEHAAAAGELALIQFSSGTTVAPKPVALTHANLLAQCAALYALMPHTPAVRQRGVVWLPLYHDMGLVASLLGLYYPGEVALLPPEAFLTRPALWLRALSRRRATISTAPSFAYALCADRIRDDELAGVDLSAWRFALNGAEPISTAVMERFCERFARYGFDPRAVVPVYGLSEATLAVSFTPPGRGLRALRVGQRDLVSVGVPIPGVAVEVRDEDGAAQRDGRLGRIFARGPSVTRGYFDDPAASRAVLAGGWLDTGDLGFVDGGELFIAGRAKDVIIIRGANHAPEEFEESLDGVPGLRAGCAVALPLATSEGEALLILAEEKPGARDETLAERIAARVAAYTGVRPRKVVVLAPGTLPRTSSGKRRRAEALRRYLGGELRPPAPVTPLRLVAAMIRSRWALVRARWRRRAGGGAANPVRAT
ncbi:MAG TPA: AMP-binding protein [Polyangia bacterium]|nr:AMP-binding protein [Polyangia bacterium]